jgi:hypothetical protein
LRVQLNGRTRRWLPLGGTLAALAASSAQPGPARADVEASSHLLVFTEASRNGKGVRVIHPQTEVAASTGSLSLRAGYELDIVSGASPRVYATSEGPDAVSGATFADVRHATRGAAGFETANVALQAGYSYGWENDYRSHTLSVSARGDFLERNFSLGLAYTRNFDQVCDNANALAQQLIDRQPLGTSDECFQPGSTVTASRRLTIDSFEPALSWTATPLLLLQTGVTLQIADGFQSNPYRAVRLGHQGREPQEHVPSHRQRYAVFARAHQALPPLRGALRLGGRLYRDTWDVRAATVDGEWLNYLGPSIIVGVRGRYHKQGGAIFFRTPPDYRTLGSAGEYFTGDRELAPLSNLMAGVKLSFVKSAPPEQQAFLDELEVVVRYDVLLYRGPAETPNADRPYAHVMQGGLSLRF